MKEEEIIQLAFNILNGLSNVELVYISPSNIIYEQKIINYLEQLLEKDVR